jgi:hypothetical protein
LPFACAPYSPVDWFLTDLADEFHCQVSLSGICHHALKLRFGNVNMQFFIT